MSSRRWTCVLLLTINLFGGRHGEHVRTVAIEQVAPTDFLIPLPFAKGVQSAVEGVIALCEADAGCHKAYPELRRQYRLIVDRLTHVAAEFEVNTQSRQ